MDLKLDINGDLAIENNDLVLVDGIDAIKQDLELRLHSFKGEWFLDRRVGIPYFQEILGQKPYGDRLILIRGLFRDTILGTPGVIGITNYDTPFDSATRRMTVSFIAQTTQGPFTYNEEFIL